MKAEQSSKKPQEFGDIGWNTGAGGPWKLKQGSKNAGMAKRSVGCNSTSENCFLQHSRFAQRGSHKWFRDNHGLL